MKTSSKHGQCFASNVIHLISKYAAYSKFAVSLYLGCCFGERQSTLNILIKSTPIVNSASGQRQLSLFINLGHWPILALTLVKSAPGPEVIKLFACSTQLIKKLNLPMNIKIAKLNDFFSG